MTFHFAHNVFNIRVQSNFQNGDSVSAHDLPELLNLCSVIVVMRWEDKCYEFLIVIALKHLLLRTEIKVVSLLLHWTRLTWCHWYHTIEFMRKFTCQAKCYCWTSRTTWAYQDQRFYWHSENYKNKLDNIS
jgi:hypothetical protein